MKFLLAGVTVAVILGLLAWKFARPQEEGRSGFRDWVKDPSWKREAAEHFAERDALTVPEDISDEEIRKMVERLFVAEDEKFNLDRLELVGEKAVPFLLEALKDPRAQEVKFGEMSHVSFASSPFERVCDLLEPFGPPAAVEPLIPFVDHWDKDFRKHAGRALGNIGTAECVEPVQKLLADEDDYVRSSTMYGIRDGIQAKRCSSDFRNSMFPTLIELLDQSDMSVSGNTPRLLLTIDKDRAVPILLSDKYFTPENGQVDDIIEVMNELGYKIPHDKLLPFLKEVKSQIGSYPYSRQYAAALIAYAYNPDENAEAVFREAMEIPDSAARPASDPEDRRRLKGVGQLARVREAGAQALSILSGVTNAREFAFDQWDRKGFKGMTRPQQFYVAVCMYDGEVNNGGHSQYFVNSWGSQWKTAIEGLEQIGATKRAAVLREACGLFGEAGPPEDHDQRHHRMSRIFEKQEELLYDFDGRYYRCDENIEVLLATFARKHRDHFVEK